jgi:uncharacterized protein YkwD
LKRLFLLLTVIIFLAMSWSFVEEKFSLTLNKVKGDFHTFIESGEMKNFVSEVIETAQTLLGQLGDTVEDQVEEIEPDLIEKPEIPPPSDQTFSIYNIKIGDNKQDVEEVLGEPKRSSYNEFGLNWYTYHQDYQNFVQVMYNESEQVVGLYTNQDLIASSKNVQLNTPRSIVTESLGKPLTKIQKGFTYYQLQEDSDYDVYLLDNSYVTIFYDIHEENTVTSIQMVHEDVEEEKEDFYTAASEQLKEGFEHQMFDLTNATRVNHGLGVLVWDEQVRETARKHSFDMAENNYFDHTNLEGQSPFDRMLEDQITFSVAGENLAYGQFSSIFAHEGLMNSLGHRENILKPEFDYLGVGVAFNDEAHPYYTQNYYTK